MQPLYKAVTWCDCIINSITVKSFFKGLIITALSNTAKKIKSIKFLAFLYQIHQSCLECCQTRNVL